MNNKLSTKPTQILKRPKYTDFRLCTLVCSLFVLSHKDLCINCSMCDPFCKCKYHVMATAYICTTHFVLCNNSFSI